MIKFKNKSKSTKKRVNKNFSSMRKSLLTNEENLNNNNNYYIVYNINIY